MKKRNYFAGKSKCCKTELDNIMNYIKRVIKLADSGGYKVCGISEVYDTSKWTIQAQILLDPEFWQSLGKALGWNMTDSFDPIAYSERAGSIGEANVFRPRQTNWVTYDARFMKKMEVFEDSPAYYWHRFIDWVADGKDPSGFFKELLTK